MLETFNFMMASKIVFALSCLVCYLRADGIPLQLPHCNPTKIDGKDSNNYIMVSTLDGRLTAFDLENGSKAWEVETAPLLSSNLASSEFDGENWVRLVPSLRGTLYTVHGSKIKRLPFNVHQLLSETFTESNNLITAGGHDILRIGIDTKTGRVIYTCNSNGCNNEQQTTENGGDVLVLTRQSTTIRGLDPRTGLEKWNFSTAAHELQLSRGECAGERIRAESTVNMLVSMRKKLVTVMNADLNEPLWEHELEAPITDIWELFDGNLQNVLWQDSRNTNVMGQLLYVGDHQGQLYILDEFDKSEEKRNLMVLPNAPKRRFISLDRNNVYLPLPDKSTYVPYHEAEDSNHTEVIEKVKTVPSWISDIVAAVGMAFGLVFIMIPFFVRIRIMVNVAFNRLLPKPEISEKVPVEIPQVKRPSSSEFPGRYEKDFTTVRCLGRGGFGVVFEAKNNIDDRSYAVKRITLPRKKEHHERVLLEAKALAKLEHQNIVQYFTAWIEPCPPSRWQPSCESSSASYLSKEKSPIEPTESDKSSFIVFGNPTEDGLSKSETKNGLNTHSEMKQSQTETKDGLSTHTGTKYGLSSQTEMRDESKSQSNRDLSNDFDSEPRLELYIQMQLCDPNSLYDWLRNNRECKDRYNKVKDIFHQIVSAVECVHLKRLIHRDLKPSNIMFALDGKVKIGDFGLVTYMHDTGADQDRSADRYEDVQHTHGVGTEVYMSPEQRKKRPYNYKVDIFSLGLILFELLQPFGTESERAICLSKIREQNYPAGFEEKYPKETDLLRLMLNDDPSLRPTTFGIRARAPLYETTNEMYHFELPTPTVC